MRVLIRISALMAWIVAAATATAQPQYQIFDIGVVQMSDTASQGFGVSTAGIAVGRSFQSSGTQAFSWSQGGGIVGLPNLAGHNGRLAIGLCLNWTLRCQQGTAVCNRRTKNNGAAPGGEWLGLKEFVGTSLRTSVRPHTKEVWDVRKHVPPN